MRPTIPTLSPAEILNETPLRKGSESRPYLAVTLLNLSCRQSSVSTCSNEGGGKRAAPESRLVAAKLAREPCYPAQDPMRPRILPKARRRAP